MAFLDELKSIETASKNKDELVRVLRELVKIHERTLLKKHLSEVYDALKREIKNAVNSGYVEEVDGEKRLDGTFSFQSYVYMDFDFETPYPDGITSEIVQEAMKHKDEAGLRTRIRVEPDFDLEKKRKIWFQKRYKCTGTVRFKDDSLWFMQELGALMESDGIKLKAITAPISKINRIISLPTPNAEIRCSYIESAKRDYTLGYDDANYITLKYSCKF